MGLSYLGGTVYLRCSAPPTETPKTQNSIAKGQINLPPFCPCCPPARSIYSMKTLPLLLLASLVAIASGYQWEPVLSDSFPWRPCSSFEATKKNCPKGEPCMADLSYAGYVPNNALKCQRSRDRLLEQYHNAKIG